MVRTEENGVSMSKEIKIICPNCGKYIIVPMSYLGQIGECPYCDQEIELNAIPKNLQHAHAV